MFIGEVTQKMFGNVNVEQITWKYALHFAFKIISDSQNTLNYSLTLSIYFFILVV